MDESQKELLRQVKELLEETTRSICASFDRKCSLAVDGTGSSFMTPASIDIGNGASSSDTDTRLVVASEVADLAAPMLARCSMEGPTRDSIELGSVSVPATVPTRPTDTVDVNPVLEAAASSGGTLDREATSHAVPEDTASSAIVDEVPATTCSEPGRDTPFQIPGVTTVALLQEGVPELMTEPAAPQCSPSPTNSGKEALNMDRLAPTGFITPAPANCSTDRLPEPRMAALVLAAHSPSTPTEYALVDTDNILIEAAPVPVTGVFPLDPVPADFAPMVQLQQIYDNSELFRTSSSLGNTSKVLVHRPMPWPSFMSVHADGDGTRPLPWPAFKGIADCESSGDAIMKPYQQSTFDCFYLTTGDIVEFQILDYSGNLCTSTGYILVHDMLIPGELRCLHEVLLFPQYWWPTSEWRCLNDVLWYFDCWRSTTRMQSAHTPIPLLCTISGFQLLVMVRSLELKFVSNGSSTLMIVLLDSGAAVGSESIVVDTTVCVGSLLRAISSVAGYPEFAVQSPVHYSIASESGSWLLSSIGWMLFAHIQSGQNDSHILLLPWMLEQEELILGFQFQQSSTMPDWYLGNQSIMARGRLFYSLKNWLLTHVCQLTSEPSEESCCCALISLSLHITIQVAYLLQWSTRAMVDSSTAACWWALSFYGKKLQDGYVYENLQFAYSASDQGALLFLIRSTTLKYVDYLLQWTQFGKISICGFSRMANAQAVLSQFLLDGSFCQCRYCKQLSYHAVESNPFDALHWGGEHHAREQLFSKKLCAVVESWGSGDQIQWLNSNLFGDCFFGKIYGSDISSINTLYPTSKAGFPIAAASIFNEAMLKLQLSSGGNSCVCFRELQSAPSGTGGTTLGRVSIDMHSDEAKLAHPGYFPSFSNASEGSALECKKVELKSCVSYMLLQYTDQRLIGVKTGFHSGGAVHAPFQGGRDAIAATIFFEQVTSHYPVISIIWYIHSNYQNTDDLKVIHTPWDPGGSELLHSTTSTAWGQAAFQGGRGVRYPYSSTRAWTGLASDHPSWALFIYSSWAWVHFRQPTTGTTSTGGMATRNLSSWITAAKTALSSQSPSSISHPRFCPCSSNS